MADSLTDMDAPEPVDVHVGSRIWRRRRELGLSRRELGERIGVGHKQINKYENGVNRVSAGRLHMIAAVLHVRTSWFFDGYGSAPSEDEPAAGNHGSETDAAEIRALLNVYHSLRPGLRRRFLHLIRAIAESDGG